MHKFKVGDFVKYKLNNIEYTIEEIIKIYKRNNGKLAYSGKTIFKSNEMVSLEIGSTGGLSEDDIEGLATEWVKCREFNKDLQHVIEENTNEN